MKFITGIYHDDAGLQEAILDLDLFQLAVPIWDARKRSWQDWDDFLGIRATGKETN